MNKGILPWTLSFVPYGIIVPLGSTNTTPPEKPLIRGPSDIVSYATVTVLFVHWNTGEFPGSPAGITPWRVKLFCFYASRSTKQSKLLSIWSILVV